jgi:ABC-type dipeptide/oligopeptide/nickel transport system permease component
MPKMTLSHFEVTLIFALLISVVLGVVTKRTDHERIRYGLKSFGYFVLTVFGLGWLMYLGHG